MNDKVFLDTNVLVYAHTDFDMAKQSLAQNVIINNKAFISTQVLQELANTLNRKFKQSWPEIETVLASATENCGIYVNTKDTILNACKLADRYKYSFYDCMIIAAALEADCVKLYSEDLHDGQVIDGKLLIENPFRINV